MQENTIEHFTVVVIGAGPTGITAATLLAQYGIDTLVLDRWAGVYPQPRAVHLDDEVYRILGRLGIATRFAAISRPAHGLQLRDSALNALAEFRRGDTGIHGFPQANMFDQPALEELLRSNLQRYPQARLRGDVEVLGLTEEPNGHTHIHYLNKADHTRHSVEASFVLGCDGANSLTRTHIGSRMRDLNFEQRWLVVDIATDADLQQWEGVQQVCDSVRAATYMRIGPDRYRWEFQLRDGETADNYQTLSSLHPLISPWTAGIDAHKLTLLRVAEYTFRAQIADRWRRGHTFLLGDAAHLTPPFIGQGMGAGLRDAMNLAWKLAGVCHGDLPDAVLDSYETERKPHAHHMIALALAVGHAMTAGGRAGNLLRRIVAPRIKFVPGLRHKIIDSRSPGLHASTLCHRSRLPRGLGGTLCPNANVAAGSRLDDLCTGGLTIVTREPVNDFHIALAARCGAGVYHAEPGTALDAWLRNGFATTAVVRPDGTVYRAGRNLGALCRRLPSFGAAAAAAGSGAYAWLP